jgi:GTP cyclohydrolase I
MSSQHLHAALLADSLNRIAAADEPLSAPTDPTDHAHNSQPQKTSTVPDTPHSRDDYGFRKSGISSPQFPADPSNPHPIRDLTNIVPDPNGLGWPG